MYGTFGIHIQTNTIGMRISGLMAAKLHKSLREIEIEIEIEIDIDLQMKSEIKYRDADLDLSNRNIEMSSSSHATFKMPQSFPKPQ
jgi:hypothetical protein